VFSRDNWMCGTMNALRDLCRGVYAPGATARYCDQSAAVLVGGDDTDGVLLLTWYKERGRVEQLLWIDDRGQAVIPTWDDVNVFIRSWNAPLLDG
jgi:hypothetical protein